LCQHCLAGSQQIILVILAT